MLSMIILATMPLAGFVAGMFLGIRIGEQNQKNQTPPVVIVTNGSSDNNNWPTSLDTDNQ